MDTSSGSESYDRTRGHRARGREAHRRSVRDGGRAGGSGGGDRAVDISDKINTLANTLEVFLRGTDALYTCCKDLLTYAANYFYFFFFVIESCLIFDRTQVGTCQKLTGCWASTESTVMSRRRPWHWWDSSYSIFHWSLFTLFDTLFLESYCSNVFLSFLVINSVLVISSWSVALNCDFYPQKFDWIVLYIACKNGWFCKFG